MLAKVTSAALVGLDAHLVDVEVDISGGLPQFSVVGLPDATVKESRDRVRSALKNTGFHFPAKRITVNLAPAGIKKEGSGLDLAIAIGILVAEDVIPQATLSHRVLIGELSLDGRVKPITGALSFGLACRKGYELILPADNGPEAALVEGVCAYPIHTLPQAVEFLNEKDSGRKTIFLFSDLEEDLQEGYVRDIPIPLDGFEVVALNVTKLTSDNIDPREYLDRLEMWRTRVEDEGGSWRVINDLDRLERLL